MLKFIDYKEECFDSMVEMIRENYGLEQSISHKDYLHHWYFDNPVGKPIITIAVDDNNNTMAGQYVISPRKFMCFGKVVNCMLSLDTLTRSAYRGQGIFTKLAQRAFANAMNNSFSFCYGAPNQNSYHGFVKKLDFTNLFEMPLFVRPLHVSKMVREKTNKFLGALCYPLNILSRVKRIKDKKILMLTLDNCGIMDDFWTDVSSKYPLMGIRDSEYMRYRYLNVPQREYYPYVYMEDNKPVAFIVARIREVSGMTTGMIADLLYIRGFEKQAIILTKYIVRLLKDLGANLAGCIMMDHVDEAKVLKKAHFFRCPRKVLPQPTPLIIRLFDQSLADEGILDKKNWFFTTGDYDVV